MGFHPGDNESTLDLKHRVERGHTEHILYIHYWRTMLGIGELEEGNQYYFKKARVAHKKEHIDF